MRKLKLVAGIAACIATALCLLLAVAATAALLLSSRVSATYATGSGTLAGPTHTPIIAATEPPCGAPGEPICPGTIVWIPLKSQSSADIIAAAQQCTLINVIRSTGGDYLTDLSHLGTPVFVHGMSAPGGSAEPDFYVIPINDNAGSTVEAAEAELNPAHSALRIMAIITYGTPYLKDAIMHMSVNTAIAAVAAQHHTTLRAGAHPTLVYLIFDAFAMQMGKITWKSGGGYPGGPIWLIPGADGKDHLVGTDGHVYYMS
ncbi:MAG: hypothetical protein ACRDHP_20900 [Ktedonobacterales bacterium]